jgi:hypothetical protein
MHTGHCLCWQPILQHAAAGATAHCAQLPPVCPHTCQHEAPVASATFLGLGVPCCSAAAAVATRLGLARPSARLLRGAAPAGAVFLLTFFLGWLTGQHSTGLPERCAATAGTARLFIYAAVDIAMRFAMRPAQVRTMSPGYARSHIMTCDGEPGSRTGWAVAAHLRRCWHAGVNDNSGVNTLHC